MKKAWQKPKLVILVRGKPAERVLVACKTSGASGDSQAQYTSCDQPYEFGTGTVACQFCFDDLTS